MKRKKGKTLFANPITFAVKRLFVIFYFFRGLSRFVKAAALRTVVGAVVIELDFDIRF